MDTMEMISKALEAVVEQKVAEKIEAVKTLETFQDMLDFVKTFNEQEIVSLFTFLRNNNETFQEMLDKEYENRLAHDDDVINKNDVDVNFCEDWDLLEDCYERYLDKACDLRDIAKNIIDRI